MRKGIEDLIFAVKECSKYSSSFTLTIAGWGDSSYINYLKKIIDTLNCSSFIIFVGPIYGSDKDFLLRNSHCFILPSFSEGLPMSVLDAWSYGIFTLISKECNFGPLSESDFSSFIDHDPLKISMKMINFINYWSHLDEIPRIEGAINCVNSEYSWNNIASDMVTFYSHL